MADTATGNSNRPGLDVIYDGECPFCSAYVRMVRLREAVGPVRLLDARQHSDIVSTLESEGIDIDETMVVDYGGQRYTGAAAVEILSVLSSDQGALNRFAAWLLRDGKRAAFLYPILRFGRNTTLRLLGKRKVRPAGSQGRHSAG